MQPLVTVVVLVLFIIYATFRAFQNAYYFHEPYISPFYSPCITTQCQGDTFPELFTGPTWISPALYILIFPLGIRMTCYYYRKAYYRSFWLSPPACAVAEPHRRYTGETRLPLIGQNIHRYALYAALVINVILFYDAVMAFRDETGAWGLVSRLNGRHMQFAWASLVSVAFADFYVLLLATDTITDLRFF